MTNIKLSPPWYILRNKVAYTIGLTPGVDVGELLELEHGYELPIKVKSCERAKAIRTILPPIYTFGNVNVFVNIYITFRDCGDLIVPYKAIEINELKELARIWCEALHGNPLYLGLYPTEKYLPPIMVGTLGQIVVIIDKKIVQFFNDNIGDLCQNYNQVAAEVFSEVTVKTFMPDYKISFTTYDSNCINFDELECR